MTIVSTLLNTLHEFCHVVLTELYEVGTLIIPISTDEKRRHREVKKHIQGHRADTWHGLDSHLGRMPLEARVSTFIP